MTYTAPDDGTPAEMDEVTARLGLLWDPPTPSTRGRRARLSLDEVVAAGTDVAREVGLDGLTMRKVAARLGAGAMTLYTYVPGRTELIDLMLDRAFAELDLPDPDQPWRPALTRYAREHVELYQRQPWILQTNPWRLPLAPHVLDADECGLRILDGAGLPPRQCVEILALVDNYVRGIARATVAEQSEDAESGLSNDAYWEKVSASGFWTTYFDPDRYPTMTRVWESGGFDVGHATFDSTFDRLLDGIEIAVDRVAAR